MKRVKITLARKEEVIPFGKLTQPILKDKVDPLRLANMARLEVQDMRGKIEDLEQENTILKQQKQQLSQQLKENLDKLLSTEKQSISKQSRDDLQETKENIQKISTRLQSLRNYGNRSYNNQRIISQINSDAEMIFEKDIGENKHTRLTKPYPSGANIKRAKILDKENLSEKQLHHQFIDHLRYDHKLSLTLIDWNFIKNYPILKQGKIICNNFVDGHLYPDGLSTGLTKQELEHHMIKVYSKHGLHFFKVDSRKTQPNFTGGAESRRGWFVKFNDNANDFTIRRVIDLQAAVNELQHPLIKLDVTSDCEGCLFVPNPESLKETQFGYDMKKLDFEVKRNFIQFPTCICFERGDMSVNFYNKPVQRFEADTLYDKIGNGLQTIIGSEAMASKFFKSQTTSFFRIEIRYNFKSQGQVAFTKRKATELFEQTNKMLDKLKELAYKSGFIHKVPIYVLWKGLWQQMQSYFIIVSKQFTTVVYGQNPYTSKYIGAQWTNGKNRMNRKFVEKLVKVYGVIGKKGYVVRFQDKDRYRLQEWTKLEGMTVLPFRTLFKDNLFTAVHLINKTLADFGLQDVGVVKFSAQIGGILSKAIIQKGQTFYDRLSKRKLDADFEEFTKRVECNYHSHSGEAEQLRGQLEFNYFSFHEHRKTLFLYMYHSDKDYRIKESYKRYFKFVSNNLYESAKNVFNTFCGAYPNAFIVTKKSKASVFYQFNVLVRINNGILVLNKGSTEESSSSHAITSNEQSRKNEQSQEISDVQMQKDGTIHVVPYQSHAKESLDIQFGPQKCLVRQHKTMTTLGKRKQKELIEQASTHMQQPLLFDPIIEQLVDNKETFSEAKVFMDIQTEQSSTKNRKRNNKTQGKLVQQARKDKVNQILINPLVSDEWISWGIHNKTGKLRWRHPCGYVTVDKTKGHECSK